MNTLIFTADRKWIEQKREKFGNPIRKLERFTNNYEGVVLKKSDYTGITVELEEQQRDAFVLAVIHYIKENFEEAKPWQYVRISGDTLNMTVFPEEEEMEKSSEETQEMQETQPVQEAEAAETAKTEETEEAVTEAQPEKNEDDSIANAVPMCYSPELLAYIKELGNVIRMLKEMHADDCIWSQNLVVSIDSGYGYSSFLRAVCKVYSDYEMADIKDMEKAIREIVISNHIDQDKKYAEWKNALNRAREMKNENRNGVKCVILSIDISQWQEELGTQVVLDYLRQINEAATNYICVFKVPFMEGQVLRKIEETLSDVMGIKTLTVAPISVESMVDYIKKELVKKNCTITDECDDALEQWIFQEKQDDSFFGYKTLDKMVKQLIYRKALLNCASGEVRKKIEIKDIKTLLNEPEQLEDPYELLNNLIGIAEVKQKIKEIVVQIRTQKELKEEGTYLNSPSIHMMFTGNPGTGKTTVARILAKILKKENVLRKGHFYEIHGRNLCGRYVGETAPKTSTYCRDAYGSVLFIDEAYSLYQGGENRDYGKEAIQTLITEMENHRDDLCVIMAGYKDEMEKLLEANPGLESRIPYIIHFPNYSQEELEQIFFKMLEGRISYGENLKEVVKDFFASIPEEVMQDKNFSNARLVRNLFERVWGKAAYRRSLSGEKGLEILKEDLLCASEEKEFQRLMTSKEHKKIGFRVE